MVVDLPRFDILKGHRVEIVGASSTLNLLSLALPIMLLQVYDRVIPNAAGHTLAVLIVALGIVLILDAILSLGRAYIAGSVGARVQHQLEAG